MRKQSRKYIPKHAKKRVPKQYLPNLSNKSGAIVAASILSATSVAGTAALMAAPAAASNWRSPARSTRARIRYRRSYAPVVAVSAAPTPEGWARLRNCESGGNYATNTGNGYYGAYQFSLTTWRSLGYSGRPSDAAPEVQDEAAAQLQARSGWGQWPACSRRAGLR